MCNRVTIADLGALHQVLRLVCPLQIVAEKGFEAEQVGSYANPSELSQSNFDASALLEQDSASRMDSVESSRARLGNSGFSRLGVLSHQTIQSWLCTTR